MSFGLHRHPVSGWVLVAGILAVAGPACAGSPPKGKPAAKAAEAPAAPAEVKTFVDTSTLKVAANFKLPTLDGKVDSLAAYRGKVVIVDFWATWCGPCRYEIPHLIQLYNDYHAKGMTILGVALDGGRSEVVSFAKGKGITYPVLLDPKSQVPISYGGVRGIPTTFIVTQDGRIYRKYTGVPQDMKTFERDVRTLLGMEPLDAAGSQ